MGISGVRIFMMQENKGSEHTVFLQLGFDWGFVKMLNLICTRAKMGFLQGWCLQLVFVMGSERDRTNKLKLNLELFIYMLQVSEYKFH